MKLVKKQSISYIFGFDGRESNETVTELRKILFGH